LAVAIKNHYIPGPNTQLADGNKYRKGIMLQNCQPGSKLYLKGNIGPGRESNSLLEWDAARNYFSRYEDVPQEFRAKEPPFPLSGVTEQDISNLTDLIILQNVGAIVPRDSVDTRVVNDVINGTGRIINSQNDVGGWPNYAAGIPPSDSDHDGMPDEWENRSGLNVNDASDANLDRNSDGYTNVEEYINILIPIPSLEAIDTSPPTVPSNVRVKDTP
jgi:hypothetical protein